MLYILSRLLYELVSFFFFFVRNVTAIIIKIAIKLYRISLNFTIQKQASDLLRKWERKISRIIRILRCKIIT